MWVIFLSRVLVFLGSGSGSTLPGSATWIKQQKCKWVGMVCHVNNSTVWGKSILCLAVQMTFGSVGSYVYFSSSNLYYSKRISHFLIPEFLREFFYDYNKSQPINPLIHGRFSHIFQGALRGSKILKNILFYIGHRFD